MGRHPYNRFIRSHHSRLLAHRNWSGSPCRNIGIGTDRDYETATQWPGTPVAKADVLDVPPWVKYERINDEAFKTVRSTVLIGMGITGAACLAVFGFFGGLGWVIAGLAPSRCPPEAEGGLASSPLSEAKGRPQPHPVERRRVDRQHVRCTLDT
jgi:hypothetical protein